MKHSISEIQITYKPNKMPGVYKMTCSSNGFDLFRDNWNSETIELFEEFKVMLLNNSNQVLGILKVSQGGFTATSVDLRLMFAAILKCGAVAIITAHNHPSGNLKPSQPDIYLFKKIKKVCDFHDINYLDNLIITSNSYFSFADEGMI